MRMQLFVNLNRSMQKRHMKKRMRYLKFQRQLNERKSFEKIMTW
jgi:hypothetical protein